MGEGGRETILDAIQFEPAVQPQKYEDVIIEMQERILQKDGPFLPDKLRADEVIPATQEGSLVGFGFLFYRNGYADIMQMVDPKHHSQGIGMELLHQMELRAKIKGMAEIHSFITDKKPSAQMAMEKAGYKVARRESGRILYAKSLK